MDVRSYLAKTAAAAGRTENKPYTATTATHGEHAAEYSQTQDCHADLTQTIRKTKGVAVAHHKGDNGSIGENAPVGAIICTIRA